MRTFELLWFGLGAIGAASTGVVCRRVKPSWRPPAGAGPGIVGMSLFGLFMLLPPIVYLRSPESFSFTLREILSRPPPTSAKVYGVVAPILVLVFLSWTLVITPLVWHIW